MKFSNPEFQPKIGLLYLSKPNQTKPDENMLKIKSILHSRISDETSLPIFIYCKKENGMRWVLLVGTTQEAVILSCWWRMRDAFNIHSQYIVPTICYRLLPLLNDFLFKCWEVCASNRVENNNSPCLLASKSSYIMYVLAESTFQIPMFTYCSYNVHLVNRRKV